MNCELCGREILSKDISIHHLVPKSRGGVNGDISNLHEICHRQIHALFDERELAILYNNVKSLKEHRDIKRFIKWISGKDPGFTVKTRVSKRHR